MTIACTVPLDMRDVLPRKEVFEWELNRIVYELDVFERIGTYTYYKQQYISFGVSSNSLKPANFFVARCLYDQNFKLLLVGCFCFYL